MIDFYKKRLKNYHNQLLKYLKYVFNDHLVLAMTFILGGLGLYYSDFVKSLTAEFKIGYLIIWVILLASLHIGKLATLIKPADQTFLLPKEAEMKDYLKASYKQSLILPAFILLLVVFILSPLLFVLKPSLSIGTVALIFFTAFGLKMGYLNTRLLQAYSQDKQTVSTAYLMWLLGSGLILAVALWQPLVAFVLMILLVATSFASLKRRQQAANLNWQQLITSENDRLNRIYRFINLFTDVPGIETTAKRRKYLDPLLAHIKSTQRFTFDYLYTRHLLRGSDYGGLVFRLLVIGMLAIGFIQTPWLAMGIGWLIIFLIGFQLLPLMNAFSYISATQLYPISSKEKQKALGRLIQKVLVLVAILFSFTAFICFSDLTMSLIFIPLLFIEIYLFTTFYLPKRLEKMANF